MEIGVLLHCSMAATVQSRGVGGAGQRGKGGGAPKQLVLALRRGAAARAYVWEEGFLRSERDTTVHSVHGIYPQLVPYAAARSGPGRWWSAVRV